MSCRDPVESSDPPATHNPHCPRPTDSQNHANTKDASRLLDPRQAGLRVRRWLGEKSLTDSAILSQLIWSPVLKIEPTTDCSVTTLIDEQDNRPEPNRAEPINHVGENPKGLEAQETFPVHTWQVKL